MQSNAFIHMDKTVISLRDSAISIGRGYANDIDLEDKAVSRIHATIVHREDSYYIEDCRSTNGTFVNGVRIFSRPYKLLSGDQINVGLSKLLFVLVPRQTSPQTDTTRIGTLKNSIDFDRTLPIKWPNSATKWTSCR